MQNVHILRFYFVGQKFGGVVWLWGVVKDYGGGGVGEIL